MKPHKLEGTRAFMFETRFRQNVTAYAAGIAQRQLGFGTHANALVKRFDPNRP